MVDQSSSERLHKINLLTRMNRGRHATPAYLAAATEALGETVPLDALMSLPDTDRIVESFQRGYRAARGGNIVAYYKFFAAGQDERVSRMADRLGQQLSDEPAYLVTKKSEDCGAIRLRLGPVLRHAISIIRLDGDSLSALSLDETEGLLIDQNPDDESHNYEVTVWGDRWASMALTCTAD